ncbi:membrane protein [Candidatus Francisella endociliophora]|uniref:Membrane protein n=1 Tax=Candidatus Francisella endociliophora TaxID=653937 RepID=A0A097ENJ3_9GAMM|nr:TIGR03546 family protein [Francisella sp. FSC1006]AIT09136.1 membrane protein [Francisella sp. FSC1006]
MSIIFSPSTPVQLLLVSLLGFIFGFIPGFAYSPLLFVLVIFLVLILRINIGLFVLISILAKMLSFPLEIVSFYSGRFLLDSFAQPIFKAAINVPVLAYAGFEYYLVTGGLFVAVVLGVAFGIFIGKSYKKFITKMAGLQSGSEAYQKVTSKLSVKIASKIIFGKNISKVDWQKIQSRRFLQPFRIWGVILVVLMLLAIVFSPQILETTLVSNTIKQQLTKANGATVDYDSLNLSLGDAKLEINGLGATDPNNLYKDRFYAKSISASIDVSGLLTKHIALKNVVIDGVALDKQRDSKGELYINKETSQDKESQTKITQKQAEDAIRKYGDNIQNIDLNKVADNAKETVDIANNIKESVEFLANFRSSSNSSDSTATNANTQTVVTPSQQAKVYGYANVKNENLREGAPSFVIQNIDVKNYEDSGTVYSAKLTNLSTNPALLGQPTNIVVKSVNNNDLDVNVVISNKPNVDNTVKFSVENVAGDAIRGLTIQGVGLDADSLSISGDGTWQFRGVNNVNFTIPLTLTLQNVGINFNKFKQNISSLTLKAVISGDLNKVGFGIDMSTLTDLLKLDTVKNAAGTIAKQAGLDKGAQQLIEKTKINGKNIKDLNAKDVKDLASSFGIKLG